ncbi:hypothetical protein RQP46_000532 [Phenoliferia psychrophenolica]
MSALAQTAELTKRAPSHDTTSFEDEKLEKHSSDDVTPYGLDSDEPYYYDLKSGAPLPDLSADMPVETQTLTVRAIIVGCALGTVVQASNLYLGLKTGFTFGPQLFGAIFGFAILKSLSKVLPTWFGGGYFGEKENVTVQTAATAAGGLGILFVSGIPAMYQLDLLGKSPEDDIGRLIGFTACCAFYGMAFAIPLRRWYILKQKLVFPTPSATALTIRSLHSGPAGAIVAKKKGFMLLYSFLGAILLRVVSQYAPGILWDWHPFWWLATWGWKSALKADNYGFFWENTPAFLGAGILTGVNASLSLYFGGIFAWGFMAPLLMKLGATSSRDFSADYNGWAVINYTKMSFANPKGQVSPRYWILWAGILVMLVCSFAEVGANYRTIYKGGRDAVCGGLNLISRRRGQEEKYKIEDTMEDPSPPEDQVPAWAWVGTLCVSIIATVTIMSQLFDVSAGISVLAVFLGFLFSFIGVQCAGDTDINPISTCAKATQLVVGGVTHGKYLDTIAPGTTINIGAMRINLLAALVSGGAAAQTTDMTGDLKTGHLLRCKPRNQFVAQACGALCSVFMSVGLFVLFTKAYPCITDSSFDTCPFGIPSVTTWAAIAKATTATNGLPIPKGAAFFALGFTLFCLAVTVAKHRFLAPKHHVYVPNWVAFALAFILPPGQSQYGLCMAVSSVACYFWRKKNIASYDLWAFPLAAGMMAGEGLGGVVNALFVVVGIDGSIYGTALGCPGNVYCG